MEQWGRKRGGNKKKREINVKQTFLIYRQGMNLLALFSLLYNNILFYF